jgi:outer membrane protein assembly factor BamB
MFIRKNSWFPLCVLCVSVVIIGCSTISLNQKIDLSPGDWLMCGGSHLQQNVSASALKPKLARFWRYNCDAGVGYSAISVADAVIFVNTLQGEMHSIDLTSGGKIGQINFLGKAANSTPLIYGNNVIVSFAGDNKYSLASYDLLKGEILWRVNLGYLETSPILYEGFIYVGSLQGKMYKIDKSSGNTLWSFNSGSAIHSTCAISNNKLIFGTDGGSIFCLDTDNGSLLWQNNLSNSILAAPLILHGRVFFGGYDSTYYCLSIDSGSGLWKQNIGTKIFAGSALYSDTNIMFGGIDGNLYCLNCADGHLEWKFPTKGVITSTPAISGDYVYFGSFDWKLYCLDCRNGNLVWSHDLDGKSKTSPVVWQNYLFAASDNYVYCFTDRISPE